MAPARKRSKFSLKNSENVFSRLTNVSGTLRVKNFSYKRKDKSLETKRKNELRVSKILSSTPLVTKKHTDIENIEKYFMTKKSSLNLVPTLKPNATKVVVDKEKELDDLLGKYLTKGKVIPPFVMLSSDQKVKDAYRNSKQASSRQLEKSSDNTARSTNNTASNVQQSSSDKWTIERVRNEFQEHFAKKKLNLFAKIRKELIEVHETRFDEELENKETLSVGVQASISSKIADVYKKSAPPNVLKDVEKGASNGGFGEKENVPKENKYNYLISSGLENFNINTKKPTFHQQKISSNLNLPLSIRSPSDLFGSKTKKPIEKPIIKRVELKDLF